MQRSSGIDRAKFLALYEANGESRSWAWYAGQLGVKPAAMQVWVSRHRDELGIPVQRVRSADHPDLFPWPVRRRAHRNAAASRFLEFEAVARELGPEALTEDQYTRWLSWRSRLERDGLVITYDPNVGYGERRATSEELEVDENGERRHWAELLDPV